MHRPIISKGYSLLSGDMARKGYVGVVDQAVVSVGNFITCVLLGRLQHRKNMACSSLSGPPL